MTYYLDLSSPQTYETFGKTDRSITGFRKYHEKWAKKINPGDRFICYMTKLSRWVGVLEVLSDYFIDKTPRYYEHDDPFIVRFKVKPLVWLDKEKAVPIHEDRVWKTLSFTKDHDKRSSKWTGILRGSLAKLDDKDAKFLEDLMFSQSKNGITYEVDENQYRKFFPRRIKRLDKEISVSIPEDTDTKEEKQSIKIQALIAKIGDKMGFKIWIPRNDRAHILNVWNVQEAKLLNVLPLNYDDVTLKTIEQIDVLWLRGRSIVRAFEVEHSTSIYSGILRMADLLALQPNMKIKLHIVAPTDRKEKVFQEIQRPVFSLLEMEPLSEMCTFISYESLNELAEQRHLPHFSDSVLEDYEETAE